MISEETKLIVFALLTGLLFRATDPQEPFSLVWLVLLFGSLLSGVFLIRVYRHHVL